LPEIFFLPETLSGQTFVKRGCCNNVQTPTALKKTLKSKCLQKQTVKNCFFIDFVLEDLFGNLIDIYKFSCKNKDTRQKKVITFAFSLVCF
jgi:hypothetical protein